MHFEELSGNAYRFTDDDRFEVLDMNAAGTVAPSRQPLRG